MIYYVQLKPIHNWIDILGICIPIFCLYRSKSIKRIDLYELNKKLDSEKIEDMEPIALYTFVSDSFYFSGINIRLLSQSKYNKKIAERYCANTLMKKLYEDRYIEEWSYFHIQALEEL